ncbi:MAG: DUF1284 domain-containing protein [Bacillota bacterium]
MIRLRGHHLVCLQFFRGEGYNREFIENLENVIGRAEKGEEIEVVEGADDVCRACPSLEDGQCASKPAGGETNIRPLDKKVADHLGMNTGDRVFWKDVSAKVSATPREWLEAFCAGCNWQKACAERKNALGLI